MTKSTMDRGFETSPPEGWDVFGAHVDPLAEGESLEFYGETWTEDGLPLWERVVPAQGDEARVRAWLAERTYLGDEEQRHRLDDPSTKAVLGVDDLVRMLEDLAG